MKSMLKKVVLGAALVAGTLGLGATQAKAERFGIVVGAPVAYRPACPGPGYVWVAGYYNGGIWIPGFWRAPRVGYWAGPGYYRGPFHFYGRYEHPRPYFRR